MLGDVLTYPFEPRSFDLVTAVASLHHMDTEEVDRYSATRDACERLLPGGRWRRHIMFRYSVVWKKDRQAAGPVASVTVAEWD